jgi:hypothetical protein
VVRGAVTLVRAAQVVVLAGAALAVPCVAGAGVAVAGSPSAPLVPRSLVSLAAAPDTLVVLDRERAPEGARTMRHAGGVEISRRLSIWRLPRSSARRLVPQLATSGVLREFEPDRTVVPAGGRLTSGDPLLAKEWWLSHVGADRVEPPDGQTPAAPVTVIDSGLDIAHPEFAARPRTTLLNAQTVTGADEWHGTAVASLVAAPANGVGGVGMFPEADLYAFDASPAGVLTTSALVAGLDRAARLGRGVVNLSLGGEVRSPIEEQVVLDAFDRGVVVVAAAGNTRAEGSPNAFPANLPHVLTVAATDANDDVAAFSTESLGVDLAAPGQDVPVAAGRGYTAASGTSFASPIVAGAAAWLWTARPELEKTQVMEVLRRTAHDVAAPGRDADTGFGIVDIAAALKLPPPAVDPLEPNDDVTQIVATGMFGHDKAPLIASARPRASLHARLDSYEDPQDVYRAWIGPGQRLTVKVRSDRRVNLELWRPGTPTVAARGWMRAKYLVAADARAGSGARTVEVTNTGRAGRFYYVTAFLPPSTRPDTASYQLTAATAAVKEK